ncbi:Transposon Ty3-G Gag-Pol polyprotein [Folsomia candida]|uniref:RNA-directed DNA polymerase n=1 Tax=Folsomia candida TaxID=158441 RepID=A0A226D8T7_FOLCA|nr:Transposon Ty3-G Gag-Pol polyprotein [Folsomia candida]
MDPRDPYALRSLGPVPDHISFHAQQAAARAERRLPPPADIISVVQPVAVGRRCLRHGPTFGIRWYGFRIFVRCTSPSLLWARMPNDTILMHSLQDGAETIMTIGDIWMVDHELMVEMGVQITVPLNDITTTGHTITPRTPDLIIILNPDHPPDSRITVPITGLTIIVPIGAPLIPPDLIALSDQILARLHGTPPHIDIFPGHKLHQHQLRTDDPPHQPPYITMPPTDYTALLTDKPVLLYILIHIGDTLCVVYIDTCASTSLTSIQSAPLIKLPFPIPIRGVGGSIQIHEKSTLVLNFGSETHTLEVNYLPTFDKTLLLGNDYLLTKFKPIIDYHSETIRMCAVDFPFFTNERDAQHALYLSSTIPGVIHPTPEQLPIKVVVKATTFVPAHIESSLEVELLTKLTDLPPLLFEFDQRFSDQHMLLAHDLFVQPSLLSSILVTNVASRPRRIPVGTTMGYLHPSEQVYEVIETNTEESTPDALFPPLRDPIMTPEQLSQININPDLTDDQRERLSKLLMGYSDVFSWDDSHRAYQGPMPVGVKLADVGDATPIAVKPYPRSFAEQQFIDEQVQILLDKKIIRPSCSPWAAPVVLVKKPDGSWRFCVAYMKINALVKPDRFPMGSMGDLFQTLHGARWFSTVDIRDGFFSIPLPEDQKEYTSFCTASGQYEFEFVPMGAKNSPSLFLRVLNFVFKDMAFGKLRHLFIYVCSPDGFKPDPAKIAVIKDFPRPNTPKSVRSFIGLCSFYRRWIPGFADICRPLHALTGANIPFVWTEDCQQSFERLRHLLCTAPILAPFNPQAPIELMTDASNYGVGAVLSQRNEHNVPQVIAYASALMNAAQRNYGTTHKELLAIIFALEHFRIYCFHAKIRVITDHHSLCHLQRFKRPRGRLARWLLALSEYDIEVVYTKGTNHAPDCLSRGFTATAETMDDSHEVWYNDHEDFRSQLVRDQSTDPRYSTIIAQLKDSTSHNPTLTNSYLLQNDILYYYNSNHARKLLAVPRSCIPYLLHVFHTDIHGGHLGAAKVIHKLQLHWHWPGLRQDVRQYVKSCLICGQLKSRNGPGVGPLHSLDVPPRPWHTIAFDLIGPIHPASTPGNFQYICTAVDYLTRFVVTAPMRIADSDTLARFLINHIYFIHGAPSVIICDNASINRSKLIEALTKGLGTTLRFTAPYQSQSNGIVEKMNRSVSSVLSTLIQQFPNSWHVFLVPATYTINTTVSNATSFTPFYLNRGYEPVSPLESQFDLPDLMGTYIERVQSAREIAKLKILEAQEIYKERWDKTHRPIKYEVGDLVFIEYPNLHTTPLSQKLQPKFAGPYQITKVLSDLNCEVRHLNSKAGTKVMNIRKFKRYTPRPPDLDFTPSFHPSLLDTM